MEAYQLLKDKLEYNQWANTRMMDWLKTQQHYLLNEGVKSGFKNINKAIHHILEAQTYYFSILTEKEATYYSELPTLRIFELLSQLDEDLLNWYTDQDNASLDQVIAIKRSPYEEKYSLATILMHLCNHSTYHRGQIIDLRHQLDMVKPPKTDYYWMFAERAFGGEIPGFTQ